MAQDEIVLTPQELAVQRTEMASERTRLANERTLVAWLRTGSVVPTTVGGKQVTYVPGDIDLQQAGEFVPREIRTGRTDYRSIEVLDGLDEGEVLGIPMVSRLKDEHERLEARIRNSRRFGASRGGERRPADQKRRK